MKTLVTNFEYEKWIEVQSLVKAVNEHNAKYSSANASDAESLLASLIRCIENAPFAEVAPVRHGQWVEEKKQTLIPVEFDDAGEPVLHDYVVYCCDQCGRTAGKKEPYCHCGAKMDLDAE